MTVCIPGRADWREATAPGTAPSGRPPWPARDVPADATGTLMARRTATRAKAMVRRMGDLRQLCASIDARRTLSITTDTGVPRWITPPEFGKRMK